MHEGEASRLWGINVAKTHAEGDASTVSRACLHWTDGGELVIFANRMTDLDALLEETEWVVGEVLAWLEQQVGGLSSTVCLMA